MSDTLFAPDASRTWLPRGELAPVIGALTGDIARQYYNSPQWSQLRAAMLNALQDFPEARDSLARAFQSLEALEVHNVTNS